MVLQGARATISDLLSPEKRDRTVIVVLFLGTLVAALSLTVNPWPRDGWFQSQYRLIGSFSGADNYTPIAAPALLYKLTHYVAVLFGFGLRGEMYVASLVQNLLVFVSSVFVYFSARLLGTWIVAAAVSIGFLAFVLSTGLPQAFWSENIVLFLFSWVIYLILKVRLGNDYTPRRFSVYATLSGLLIGILVATRMTPIFLIPGLFLLFIRQWKTRRFLSFIGTVVAVTILVITAMLASNYARFDRIEITASSGRHLWQGVNLIVDEALGDSEEYQYLRSFNGGLVGKDHWEVRVPKNWDGHSGDDEVVDKVAKDAVLRSFAKQAIANRPLLYLCQGLQDFAKSIGRRPYRVGFGSKGGHWDPLQTDNPLPPLASDLFNVPAGVVNSIAILIHVAWFGFGVLYPVAIFFALTSLVAAAYFEMVSARTNMEQELVASNFRRSFTTAVFGAIGVAAIVLVVWRIPSVPQFALTITALATILCCIVLSVQLAVFYRWQASDYCREFVHGLDRLLIFAFLAAIFFGSLWFSWQVESNNSRNALSYQPFLALMVCLAINQWSRGVRRFASDLFGHRGVKLSQS